MKKFAQILLTVVIIGAVGLLVAQYFAPGSGLSILQNKTVLEQGDAALSAGDNAGALALYNQAIASGSDLSAAYARRGNLFTRQRQFSEAVADYTQAHALSPSPVLLAARCNAYRLSVQLDAALADCQAAYQQNPDNIEIAVATGLLYVDRKDPANARQVVEAATAANPDSDRLFYVLAQIANIEGDTPRVIEMLSRCIEINPNSVQYFWDRGFAHYMNAQLDESKADLYKVIKLGDPLIDGETLYFAGNLLRMMGENP